MNIKKIVIGGAAATALGIAALAGTGTAFATGIAQTANTHQSSNVQQDGQHGPDSEAADGQKDGQHGPDSEAADRQKKAESGVSDGPGGHVDANGSNVDHQFEGNE